jgi:NAD(P)-dependent dehydrogenase (short-subunit alcohol dehydrogenase family)
MELAGKTVVLTGATSGIGLATAQRLAGRVGLLILHGIEPSSPLPPRNDVAYFRADFSSLEAVAGLASRIRGIARHIDILVNNAARPGPPHRTIASSGFELTFQTNYLATVALTRLLGEPERIVNVASATHLSATLDPDDVNLARHRYAPGTAYAQSKLALVTETCRLAGTLPETTRTAVSVHPGIVSTALLHAMFSIRGDDPQHAAGNLLHVIGEDYDNGTYYDESTPAAPNPAATAPAFQRALFELTETALKGVPNV